MQVTGFPQEFRINVRGLTIEMYVTRLDRPWLGTSYPLQGVKLKTEADVEKLQRLCNHVFVDVSRGLSPEPRFIELETTDLIRRARGHDEIAGLHKTSWEIESEFLAELPEAEKAHGTLKQGIAEVMQDLQAGKDVQLVKLKNGVDAMIESITRNPSAFMWLKAIKRKDNYAYQHALSCSIWSASFGRHLGLDRDDLGELALCGLLFDVGKTKVSSETLGKNTPLDEADHHVLQAHVQHGLDMLASTSGLSPRVLEAIATHHERHDGSGYPHGLSGHEIPMFGRIIGLIDSYDAMTSVRPYMDSRSPHHAVMELYQARDKLFQAELVEHFIQTCGIYPTGSLVELSDGRVGVITSVHNLKRLRPQVMLLLDADKNALADFRSIDLSELSDPEDPNSEPPISIKRGLPQGAYQIDPAELFLD